jgi:hypothetical protein
VAERGQSKSPDKYHINGALVVSLNERQVPKNPQLQQFNMQQKYKAGVVFPSTTTATTANSYSTEQRKASDPRQSDQFNMAATQQRFNSINIGSLNQNMLVGNLVGGANPIKLSLPLRYLKNNAPKKHGPGTAKGDANRTVMVTGGVNLSTIQNMRTAQNTSLTYDPKKTRLPLQLFQAPKLSQTIEPTSLNSKRGKHSQRQPTPEREQT